MPCSLMMAGSMGRETQCDGRGDTVGDTVGDTAWSERDTVWDTAWWEDDTV